MFASKGIVTDFGWKKKRGNISHKGTKKEGKNYFFIDKT
jgi:hypothetical protein